MLDLSSFEKALNGLDEVLAIPVDPIIRDSAIQRFEYSYELSVKMLRRQLENMADLPIEVEHMGFKQLIRTGAEKGFIDAPEAWFDFREKRNITTHTYNEKKAVEVYLILPGFAKKARLLLNELKKC